jgi:hypothetical protein
MRSVFLECLTKLSAIVSLIVLFGALAPAGASPWSGAPAASTFAYDGGHHRYDRGKAVDRSRESPRRGRIYAYDEPSNLTQPRTRAFPPILAAKAGRGSFDVLSDAAAAPFNDTGLSVAGRALQKHGGRPGGALPPPTGNPAAISAQAQDLVRGVLQNPARTRTMSFNKRLGEDVVDIRVPGGIGLRYTRADGRFVGFLESRR